MQTARLTGLLTFPPCLLGCRPAAGDARAAPSLLRLGFCPRFSIRLRVEVGGGRENLLTFEGAALFISRRVNVREQSSVALGGNRNQRGQRPRRINHLPLLYRIGRDPIPRAYTDSAARERFTARGILFSVHTTQSVTYLLFSPFLRCTGVT